MSDFQSRLCNRHTSRRELLRTGLFGVGIGAALPAVFGKASLAMAADAFQSGKTEVHPERILVVVELTGGNDGLDTVIPFSNDDYHRARPTLGCRESEVLKVDDSFGLHPSLGGLKTIWDDGLVSVIHGCGYPNPNRSHFSSMEYWHTAMPYEASTIGWVGRLADAMWPVPEPNTIVNITQKQSLAVQAERHSPVVFQDPERFVRAGDPEQAKVYNELIDDKDTGNATLDFLSSITRDANKSSVRVREAVRDYTTPVAYSSSPLALDLRKVAALINAGFPTRVYYVSLAGFDTHASQSGGRRYLLTGLGEALRAFHQDLKRLGRGKDVSLMMFSEFGRRVAENASLGTDHGTAGPMFLMGESVKPGFCGEHPSLTDLDENEDLKMTMDFRRVYMTAIEEWMGYSNGTSIVKGDFQPLGLIASENREA